MDPSHNNQPIPPQSAKLTRKILLDVNPALWGQRQAANPAESACASPARLFLDARAVTDKRIRRFY
jgi:hypothetical protein